MQTAHEADHMTPEDLEHNLGQFYGTEQYHRLGPMLLTDGAYYLAQQAGAFWLMDAIAAAQPLLLLHPKYGRDLAEYQFWTLTVNSDRSAELLCERDTDQPVLKALVKFTDFPLQTIKLYVEGGVILLPSEH
ncbi:MAG: hypothetical protein C4524_06430 [Candidatus Zixiibacteriota bacterium]|nr:MAG: hypothetical protein C4524_06430 [candidate division Zixibacteria bacterium]